jgi:hypothetical protein
MRTLLLLLRRRDWRLEMRQLLFALACVQVFAPATAAIADAWRMDRREPYAHIEQPGTAGCVVVHGDDCLLCSIATSAQARPAGMLVAPAARQPQALPAESGLVPTPQCRLRHASSRAPPSVHG